jgi:hypothetical protein
LARGVSIGERGISIGERGKWVEREWSQVASAADVNIIIELENLHNPEIFSILREISAEA